MPVSKLQRIFFTALQVLAPGIGSALAIVTVLDVGGPSPEVHKWFREVALILALLASSCVVVTGVAAIYLYWERVKAEYRRKSEEETARQFQEWYRSMDAIEEHAKKAADEFLAERSLTTGQSSNKTSDLS